MRDLSVILSIVGALAGIVFLLGFLQLYLRLRNLPSLVALTSTFLLALWGPVKTWALQLYVARLDRAEEFDSVVQAIGVADQPVTVGLLLTLAVSFLLSARSVMRPNNSFKPKPLRGSA